MYANEQLSESVRPVPAFGPGIPSSAAPAWISMKGYERCCIVVFTANAGAGVTPAAVALQQAKAVAGTDAKALPFTGAKRNVDTGAGSALSAFAVANNTFTADGTVSKNGMYVIEVKAEDLDTDAGYDCIRVTLGDAAAQTVMAAYLLYGAKFNVRTDPQVD